VTGYSIYVRSLESSDTGSGESGGASEQSNITTDGNTHSLTLNNLSPSLTYEVFVSAFNQEGSGPPSASLILRTDPMGGLLSRRPKDRISSILSKDMITSMDPMKQPWWLLVIILLTVMFIFSSGVLIFLMRQRSNSHKSSSNKNQSVQHISLSLPKNYDPANHPAPLVHDSMWIDRSWYNGGGSGGGRNGGTVDQRREQSSLLSHHQLSNSSSSRGVQQPLLGPNLISQQKQTHLFTNWSNNAPGNHLVPAAANAAASASNASPYDHSLVLDENDSSVYSVIESSHNDYAEVSESQNLSSFRRNQHHQHHNHNQQSSYTQSMLHNNGGKKSQPPHYQSNRNQMQSSNQQDRPTTPGPYATTNLINITSNAMYRDLH
jgi:hypothetical protein